MTNAHSLTAAIHRLTLRYVKVEAAGSAEYRETGSVLAMFTPKAEKAQRICKRITARNDVLREQVARLTFLTDGES